MTTELTVAGVSLEPEYTPASLSIPNVEEITKRVNAVAAKYHGQIVTPKTMREARKSRADLNKTIKALNAYRITLHKQYEEPYAAFKQQVDTWTDTLQETVTELKNGIDEVDTHLREQREAELANVLTTLATEAGVDPELVPLQHSWTNKSMYYTPDSEPKAKDDLKIAVRGAVALVAEQQVQIKRVNDFAQGHNVNPMPYTKNMQVNWDDQVVVQAHDVIEQIKTDIEAEQKRQATKDGQVKQLANGKLVDKATGEVKHTLQQVTFTVKGTKEQLDKLAQYLGKSGLSITADKRIDVVD